MITKEQEMYSEGTLTYYAKLVIGKFGTVEGVIITRKEFLTEEPQDNEQIAELTWVMK